MAANEPKVTKLKPGEGAGDFRPKDRSGEGRKGGKPRGTPGGQRRTQNPCILEDGSVDPQCRKVYQRSVAGRQTLASFLREKEAQGMTEKDIFMAAVNGLMSRRLGYVGAYLDSKSPGRTYKKNEAMAIVDAAMSKAEIGENPGARLTGPSGGGRQRGKAPEKGKAGASVRQQRKQPGGRGGGMGMPETWSKPGSSVDENIKRVRDDVRDGKDVKAAPWDKTEKRTITDEGTGEEREVDLPARPEGKRGGMPAGLQKSLERIQSDLQSGKISKDESKRLIEEAKQKYSGEAKNPLRELLQKAQRGEQITTEDLDRARLKAKTKPAPIPGTAAGDIADKRAAKKAEEKKAEQENLQAAARAGIESKKKKGRDEEIEDELETSREDLLADDEEDTSPEAKQPGQVTEIPEKFRQILSSEFNSQLEIQARANLGLPYDQNKKLQQKILDPRKIDALNKEKKRLQGDPDQRDFLVDEAISEVKAVQGLGDDSLDEAYKNYLISQIEGGPAPEKTSPATDLPGKMRPPEDRQAKATDEDVMRRATGLVPAGKKETPQQKPETVKSSLPTGKVLDDFLDAYGAYLMDPDDWSGSKTKKAINDYIKQTANDYGVKSQDIVSAIRSDNKGEVILKRHGFGATTLVRKTPPAAAAAPQEETSAPTDPWEGEPTRRIDPTQIEEEPARAPAALPPARSPRTVRSEGGFKAPAQARRPGGGEGFTPSPKTIQDVRKAAEESATLEDFKTSLYNSLPPSLFGKRGFEAGPGPLEEPEPDQYSRFRGTPAPKRLGAQEAGREPATAGRGKEGQQTFFKTEKGRMTDELRGDLTKRAKAPSSAPKPPAERTSQVPLRLGGDATQKKMEQQQAVTERREKRLTREIEKGASASSKKKNFNWVPDPNDPTKGEWVRKTKGRKPKPPVQGGLPFNTGEMMSYEEFAQSVRSMMR